MGAKANVFFFDLNDPPPDCWVGFLLMIMLTLPALLSFACLWMIALGSSSHRRGPPPGVASPPRPLLLHPRDKLPKTMGNSNLRLRKPSYLGVCWDVTGGLVGSCNCANEILALLFYAYLWMIAPGSSSHRRGPSPGIASPPRPLLLHLRESLPMTMGTSNLQLPKQSYLGVCCNVTGGRVGSHNCANEILALLFYACLWMIVLGVCVVWR